MKVALLLKKVKLVWLSFKLRKWHIPKGMRTLAGAEPRSRSFNGVGGRGRRGLMCRCFESDVETTSSTLTRLQWTGSCSSTNSRYDYHTAEDDDLDDVDDDVDLRAEIFINNFRSRLLLERELFP